MKKRDSASAEGDEGAQAERTSSVRLRHAPEARLRHDMRSAVHTVLGFANLLRAESHGPLTPEQLVFVEHMQGAAHDLERLLDIHLELSRDAGREREESHPFASLLPRIARRLRTEGIRCEFEPAGRPIELKLHVERFERACIELAKLVCRGEEVCTLRCVESESGLAFALHAVATRPPTLDRIDAYDRELDNRTALTLRYAEALLGSPVVLDAACRWVECCLRSE